MNKSLEESVLENAYQERLEERIISHIALLKKIPLEESMDFYYKSRLADKIAKGEYGIQYLDYKVLAELIIQNQ